MYPSVYCIYIYIYHGFNHIWDPHLLTVGPGGSTWDSRGKRCDVKISAVMQRGFVGWYPPVVSNMANQPSFWVNIVLLWCAMDPMNIPQSCDCIFLPAPLGSVMGYLYVYIYIIYIWVNFITSSLFDRTLEIMVYVRENIPKWPNYSG